jgi:hypothetical protein
MNTDSDQGSSRVIDDERPPQARSASGRGRSVVFYLSAVLCALFMVRILGKDWNTGFPASWPDALFPKEGYVPVAGLGPFNPRFYFEIRPIGYPLFLWVFARNSHPVVVAQTALYCATVAALCTTAWRVLRSRVLAGLTIALLIGIAIQPKYAMWNTQILSESLSISLGFAVIAAWWRFAAEPTRRRAIWGWVFVIAWMLVRDTNVLAAAIVIPAALLIAWLARGMARDVRRALAIGAVAVAVTAGYSIVSQDVGLRADLQFQDLIGVRVLPDAQLTNWFASHGMPLDDALRTRTGKAGFDDTFWRSKDPTFARYFHWSNTAGRRTYVESLFAMPSHYRNLFYKDLPGMLKADMSYYDTHQVYSSLPRQMPMQLGGPSTRKGLTVWLLVAIVALGATAFAGIRHRAYRRLALLGAIGIVLVLSELFVSWFGEPLEIPRHAIGAVCMIAVVLAVVVATGVDAALRIADDASAHETGTPEADDAAESDDDDPEASFEASEAAADA